MIMPHRIELSPRQRAIKTVLTIGLMLLIGWATFNQVHEVLADGSVPAADIIYSFSNENQYPWNYTTRGPCTINGFSHENVRIGDRWVLLGGSTFNHTIDNVAMRLGCTDSDQNNFQMVVYEFTAQGNAGALITQSGVWEETSINSASYTESQTFNNVSIPTGYDTVYVTFMAGTQSGSLTYHFYQNDASEEWFNWIYDSVSGVPDLENPLTGESSVLYRVSRNRIDVSGWGRNQTEVNTYWGNVTYYTARRDLTWDFPATYQDTGAVAYSARNIKVIYPKTEALINMTWNDRGTFNDTLPTGSYTTGVENATHRYLELDNTAIGLYGDNYQMFTETKTYQYTFNRPCYENGTLYSTYVTVRAHQGLGQTDFNVDSDGYIFGDNIAVDAFSWSIGTNTRYLYPATATETITPTMPDNTYGVYTMDIVDYTGRLGGVTDYLEMYRAINSTYTLIEREPANDAKIDEIMHMVVGQSYRFKLLWDDGTTYLFGDLLATTDLTRQLILGGLTFSEQAQMTYKYINVEATRPIDTTIRVNYEDTTPTGYETTWCNVSVCFRNGTEAWSSYTDAETAQLTWTGANNETDYLVLVTIQHEYFGSLNPSFVLPGGYNYNTGIDLGVLGTFGGINTANLFTIIVCLIVLRAFGWKNAPLGLFVCLTVASVLKIMGWNNIDNLVLGSAWAMAVGYAVLFRRNQV